MGAQVVLGAVAWAFEQVGGVGLPAAGHAGMQKGPDGDALAVGAQINLGLLGWDVVQAGVARLAGLFDQPGRRPADPVGPPPAGVLLVLCSQLPDTWATHS